MQNIKILKTPDFLEKKIPAECVPHCFAIATNILLCTPDKGLLLFNYEPQKWNQWYPYFSSVNDVYDFKGETYQEIVEEFYKEIIPRDNVQNRVCKAEDNFLKLLEIPNGEVKLEESPIKPEIWLKYSKTQNIWTFYYIEFLQVKSISKIDLEVLDKNVVDFMPLNEAVVSSVLESGKFKGIDVVDNTLDIIKDKENLKKILNLSIVV